MEFQQSIARTLMAKLHALEALDLRSTKVLKQDGDDVAIFEDALKGIGKIKQLGFNTDGIIAVNKEFDSKSDEQPKWPGHLRNAYHNEDDRIGIATDSKTHQAFVPKDQITRTDLDEIVNQYDRSTKKERPKLQEQISHTINPIKSRVSEYVP